MFADEKALKAFLVEAKRLTYAGNGEEVQPTRPMSRDLPYQKGDYYYFDTYLGELNFIGEEAVWYDGKAVWGMNYFGEMLTDEVPGEFSKCLKEALKAIPLSTPFRGPAHFAYGELEYRCVWEGDMPSFSGEETISHRGSVIYRLRFHGGYLKF